MKYQVILFDADETLFDFKKSEREAFKNSMIKFGFNYDENYHLKIYQEINTAIWKEFEEGLITQSKLKTDRFKRLADKLKSDFDAEAFSKSYVENLADASFLLDGADNLLDSLHSTHKISIVTNGLASVQDKRVRKSSVAKYFDTVVISDEITISKPNPKIFEHTLEVLNYTDKSKVLMVGDSLTSDIQGGINFGIDTCWFNPTKAQNNTSIKPTYEVSSFEELKNLLLTV